MSQREIQILFVAQENTVQGRQRRYTMQSSITDVCLSHAACTEQKSPQENTCTCTTAWPASLFFESNSNTSWDACLCCPPVADVCTVRCSYKGAKRTLTFQPDQSSVDYIYIHMRNQVILGNQVYMHRKKVSPKPSGSKTGIVCVCDVLFNYETFLQSSLE